MYQTSFMDKFVKIKSANKEGTTNNGTQPLAAVLRPQTLTEFVGQQDIVGEGSVLRRLILSDAVPSLILWGPPGSGKTTLAHIIAKRTNKKFIQTSAVTTTLPEVREIITKAEQRLRTNGQTTILFLDEIHRFNKLQQDVFLPYVEPGIITLIGATTENPSFSINNALLSRCQVFRLKEIGNEEMSVVIQRGLMKINSIPIQGSDPEVYPYNVVSNLPKQFQSINLIQNRALQIINKNDRPIEEVDQLFRKCLSESASALSFVKNMLRQKIELQLNEQNELDQNQNNNIQQEQNQSTIEKDIKLVNNEERLNNISEQVDQMILNEEWKNDLCYICPKCHCIRIVIVEDALQALVQRSNGDCRSALGYLEMIVKHSVSNRKERVQVLWVGSGLDVMYRKEILRENQQEKDLLLMEKNNEDDQFDNQMDIDEQGIPSEVTQLIELGFNPEKAREVLGKHKFDEALEILLNEKKRKISY
ncbi:MAG: putative Replication-associated recombination protein A [Streblomastix strix]|uniref:Putative Replication-associated recombination protein A n=1 Tax=Streblomastix strix TaxID=222440 RepID=A0A5J4W5K7_9EUKA|nr:MAG: putative Replication-associated recombination protein A [Streblomastix strix]